MENKSETNRQLGYSTARPLPSHVQPHELDTARLGEYALDHDVGLLGGGHFVLADFVG